MLQTPALEETTVIVVNYNAIDFIANCLESLFEAKEIIFYARTKGFILRFSL